MQSIDLITISLTRYNEPNSLFHQTLLALSKQQKISAKVLVLDQLFDEETLSFCEKISTKKISFDYIHVDSHILSYVRNFAIKKSKTDILLYLDTDAIPVSNWAYELATLLSEIDVGIVGGKILPKYEIKPLYIHKYDRVKNFYSLLDFGSHIVSVHKIVGANFGININHIGSSILFDECLGRQKGSLLSGEETAFCSKVEHLGLHIYYNGAAIVEHQISSERISYLWLWKRVFYQGMTRFISGKLPSFQSGKKERKGIIYYFFICVFGFSWILGYIYGFIQRKMHIKST